MPEAPRCPCLGLGAPPAAAIGYARP